MLQDIDTSHVYDLISLVSTILYKYNRFPEKIPEIHGNTSEGELAKQGLYTKAGAEKKIKELLEEALSTLNQTSKSESQAGGKRGMGSKKGSKMGSKKGSKKSTKKL
jgi:hypothetical protein